MNITEEVRLVLDNHLIGHSRLKLNPLSQSRHHAVTDYKRVYVKVLKPSGQSHANMLQTEVDFAFNTGYGTNPLMEEIFHRNSKNRTLIMSAWEFEKQVPIIYNVNPVQVAQAAHELYRIHSFPKYKELREDANEEFNEYAAALTSHAFGFLTANQQTQIRLLYNNVILPATESIILNPATNVVSHGQAKLEKAVIQPRSVQWVDYELVRSAPREYDASMMFLQLHHRIKRPDLWQLFRKQYEMSLGRPLNDSLLEQFAALHLGRKALKLTMTTLYTMKKDQLLAFLHELTRLTVGKTSLENMNLSYMHWT